MNVTNCPRCGKLFNKLRRDICPSCGQQEDKEYEIVRDYIYDNPKSDVTTVSEDTGIPVETIVKFLRENRLLNVSGTPILECEGCGSMIASGKYCSDCSSRLGKALSGAFSKDEKKDEPTGNNKKSASFHFMKDRLDRKR